MTQLLFLYLLATCFFATHTTHVDPVNGYLEIFVMRSIIFVTVCSHRMCVENENKKDLL